MLPQANKAALLGLLSAALRPPAALAPDGKDASWSDPLLPRRPAVFDVHELIHCDVRQRQADKRRQLSLKAIAAELEHFPVGLNRLGIPESAWF
jgi:hypothetical protein